MGSSNRRPYLTSPVMNQAFLDECASNLENRLELAADITPPIGPVIHVSDRNKYVINSGTGTFYQALTQFPTISRTLGEWLSTEVQFSSLTLEFSGVDGRFNSILPAGANFDGWIGSLITVMMGIAETGTTYSTIFSGKITDVAGFARSIKSITLTARDIFDIINFNFPATVFTLANFPKIDDDLIGTCLPIVYGDWTVLNDPVPANVKGIPINGSDLLVNPDKRLSVTIADSSDVFVCGLKHKLDNDDPVQLETTGTLPSPFVSGTTYFVVNSTTFTFGIANTVGGSAITSTGGGSGVIQVLGDPTSAKRNVKCVIADDAMAFLNQSGIYLKRGDTYFLVPSSEIVNVSGSNNYFEVLQQDLVTWVDSAAYTYGDGDEFVCLAKGKDLGPYSDNIVWQARDILMSISGLSSGDFDANWATYRDKATPAQSAIANIPARVWTQDQVPVMQYVQSMMQQVRLEMFISRDQKVKINSLHFEDFQPSPSFSVKNWDVIRDTFAPKLDERINFNRAQGVYNFLPSTGQEARQTAFYKNTASITQSGQKPISKKVIYPNLYVEQDVINQLIETLRIASSSIEVVECQLTWRALLQDLGNFVALDVKAGASQYDLVPCMVRDIGYDPQGLKIPVKLWSFQVCPFPGYSPGYAGTVGGYNATIDQE